MTLISPQEYSGGGSDSAFQPWPGRRRRETSSLNIPTCSRISAALLPGKPLDEDRATVERAVENGTVAGDALAVGVCLEPSCQMANLKFYTKQ